MTFNIEAQQSVESKCLWGCVSTALSTSIFHIYVIFDRAVSMESEMTQT